MLKALKDKWIAALRSGDYQQVGGALCVERTRRTDNPTGEGLRYCCLGVLCDIAELEKSPPENLDRYSDYPDKFYYDEDKQGYVYNYTYINPETKRESSADEVLPEDFRRRLGISDPLQKHLTELNDAGASFESIADEIEKNLICEDEPNANVYIWSTTESL